MNIPKQERETRQVELVETLNLYRSLKRVGLQWTGNDLPWRRALYHALGMAGLNRECLEKIRQALELP